ncbi:putative Ig domain-containing protein [Shinella curvata]|uniref:putative Ig domain-containing protein n=1 Tax=Shinella curvata TaxID=1817964 RepID=UPI001FD5BFC9|nr:putative Ig domain-containing protein [Shinella curvata]MCJ8055281.1 putative Ig domain-containing protein [Shinella curvata]
MAFTAVGQTQTINTSSCENTWNGDYSSFYNTSMDITNNYGLGAEDETGLMDAETEPGSNGGLYEFQFDINTAQLQIKLLTAPSSSTDTYSGYMFTGANDANPPIASTPATINFTYSVTPTVTSVSPGAGPTGGGTTVVITGTGFSGANATGAVKFGATNATYTINSDTQITATSPANSAGTYDITVTTPGGTSATSAADQYTYVSAPTVTSVSPTAGPTWGGTSVTITGTGFTNATAVTFGSTAASGFTVISATTITATAPAGTGTVDIRVTTVGGTSATSAADQYTYVSAPTVSSVSPTAGPTGGGTTVIITGTGFAAANPTGAVKFGATNATYTINSNTQITATSPANSAGTYDITVTTVGGTSATTAGDQFTYVPAPTVTSVSPTAGPTAGGMSVTITGTNLSGATGVTFGGTAASWFTVLNGTTITATSPAGAVGTVDIRVTTIGGTSAVSAADQYTYVAAPTVTSVSPTAGPTAGGTSVVITGTGFSSATSVTFGGTAATGFTVNSATQITATAPAGTGTVDIRVTTIGGTSATSAADQFTYVPAPTVTSVSPTAGPTAGTTSVVITGTGLSGATAVTFGGTAATGFTVNSATQITATAPAGAAGTVDIRVTTIGGTSATSVADQFTYVAAPVATSFTYGAIVPYNDGANTSVSFDLSSHAANNPTGYAVGSATTAQGGSVSVDNSGQVTYTPPTFYRNANDSFSFTASNVGGTSSPAIVTLTIGNPTISVSLPSATATVGTAYNTGGAEVTLSGGKAPYTVNSMSGLPAGMASSGAVLDGTPTVDGTFTVNIYVTDNSTGAGPYTANVTATLTVVLPPPPVVTGFAAPAVAYNAGSASATTFSLAAQATGNPTDYAVGSATSANGGSVSIDSAGLVTYTPPVGFRGNDSFTFTAINQGGASSAATVTVPVNDPVFSVTLPASTGTVGDAYNSGGATVSVNGGAGPYSNFSASGLPAGLSISSSGVISGTPTTAGNATVVITATDSSSGLGAFTGTASVALGIAAPTITINPATLSNAAIGVSYSATLSNTGGLAPVSFAITAGALPPGLTLDTTGSISGVSTGGGTYNFTVTATDGATTSGPYTGSRTYALAVDAATIALSPAAGALPTGTTGIAYSQTVTAAGGIAPYSYALTAGTLPDGLTLAMSGTLSGTPTTSGTFSFTVTGTDSSTGAGPYTNANAYTLTIGNPTLSLSPAAGALPAGTAGTVYNQTFTASNGTAPYSYAVTSGALPNGLALSTAGVVSGTPDADGAYSFDVTATDAHGATITASYSLAVGVQAPIANAVALTVAANASAKAVTLNITGGAAASVAVATAASHGTATASGNKITYKPVAGYSGTDSFTYTATNATGTSSPATVTVTVTAPTLVLSPAAGALPAGTVGTAYSKTFSATKGTAPYSYAVTSGALPNGLALSTAGVVSGTPDADGAYSFDVTATDAFGATITANYSLAVGVQAPVANAVALTVAANASAKAVTLNITGGAATSVAVATAASHGTATASGNKITYKPVAGYSGTDSFTYTATNATGTSSPATVTVTVTAPTLVLSPAAGALPAGTVGTAYSKTFSATKGTAPYSYAVTTGSLPAGLTLDGATGKLNGKPTAAGSFDFALTATDTYGATGTASYSLVVGGEAPIANAVALTVAANASAKAVTLNITGGTATSVAVATAAAHGTTTASKKAITYKPVAGYSGLDTFTYTATNAAGTSSPATVTVTVTPPKLALSPAAGALPRGTVGKAYRRVLTASKGTAPYSYAVTAGALPTGLVLDGTAGTIGGTPTTAGSFGFTVTATDAYGATGSAAYEMVVKVPVVVFAFTPPAGSLGKTMAGEDYSQQIKATGGAAPLLYSLASGKLPKGMVLNVSTGELTGPLDAASKGNYSFKIAVRDNNGATGSATYSLSVTARQVTASNHVVNVPAGGSPADVYLNGGATGGPFTAAEATFVEPANAGTASIIRGQVAQAGPVSEPVGWYLQFSPNPAFSGAAKVGYRLSSELGTSNTGTVTYNLQHDAQQVAEDIDALVRGFVETRQGLIANGIYVPGLQERRQMEQATDTVTARMTPSEDGMTASFSTSLAQMDAARDRADGIEGAASSAFNAWIDGAFLAHKRDQNDGRWGSFAMLNLGADYLISEKALVGLSFHLDRMTDPSDADAELTGNGWLAGPYASLEIGKGVFWDTSLLYGGSANDIDTAFWDGSFDTQRWMIDTAIKGEWQIGEATVLTPKLRAIYFNEKVDDYTVHNGDGDELDIEGFDAEQFRVSLGAEIARSFTLESGATVTPKLGVTAGYAGIDGSGFYGSVTAGIAMQTSDFWMLEASLLLNLEGDGQKSVGATVRAGKQF